MQRRFCPRPFIYILTMLGWTNFCFGIVTCLAAMRIFWRHWCLLTWVSDNENSGPRKWEFPQPSHARKREGELELQKEISHSFVRPPYSMWNPDNCRLTVIGFTPQGDYLSVRILGQLLKFDLISGSWKWSWQQH